MISKIIVAIITVSSCFGGRHFGEDEWCLAQTLDIESPLFPKLLNKLFELLDKIGHSVICCA